MCGSASGAVTSTRISLLVGERAQVVDRVQLPAGVGRVVHTAHAETELEAQGRVVPQGAGRAQQVLAVDVEGQFAPVDHDLVDHVGRVEALLLQRALQLVGHLVEPAAVRANAGRWQRDRGGEAAEAGGVAAALGTEHALAPADHLDRDLLAGGGDGGAVRGAVLVRHRSSPRISLTGVACSARASPSSSARRLFTPSGSCWILSCSFRIASISISGRGGQPGR